MQTYLEEYNALKHEIDRLRASVGDAELESRKGNLLKASHRYMDFLEKVTGLPRATLATHIDECAHFLATDSVFMNNLALLAHHSACGVQTGEIRVHSYTLFVTVRAFRPLWVLETGVANGKSSFMILKAMDLNLRGTLVSVDMPTIDSSGTDRHKALGMETGWLVPAQLRGRWDLRIGPSHTVLPQIGNATPKFDIFLHDSLSNYENMMFEYNEARRLLKAGGLLISDDIETCRAFEEFAARYATSVACFGTLGVMRLGL